MEEETGLIVQRIELGALRVLIIVIHLEEHKFFLKIIMLHIGHWRDDLLEQLIQRFNVVPVRH